MCVYVYLSYKHTSGKSAQRLEGQASLLKQMYVVPWRDSLTGNTHTRSWCTCRLFSFALGCEM